jgi:prepilin-type processing-associated H-X9-DG protein/prepilin-type N-terminal cleavage/methylation domain-containing protein
MTANRVQTVTSGSPSPRTAFTLIELLVVIAIIGVLVGLLLPAVQQAREAARRTACSNNMKQIGLALHNYAHSHRERLPTGWVGEYENGEIHGDEGPGWGWASQLLPFMEENAIYDGMNFDQAIGHTDNDDARVAVISTFLCPSDSFGTDKLFFPGDDGAGSNDDEEAPDATPGAVQFARSNYPGMFGAEHMAHDHGGGGDGVEPSEGDGTFVANTGLDKGIFFRHFTDGLSKTIAVGERDSRMGGSLWIGMAEGKSAAMSRVVGVGEHLFNSADPHFEDFYSQHPGGMNVVFADGHVAFLSNSIGETTFQALATRSGGEPVSSDY